MAVVIAVPVDTVANRAVLKVGKITFDLRRQSMQHFGLLYDLQRGVADDAAAEGDRVLFEIKMADHCLKLRSGLFGL